jgi:hypothetical protein
MIETTDSELHALQTIRNARRRKGTTTLAVSAEALEHLLNDHHTLYTALRERKLLQITVGPDQESLK